MAVKFEVYDGENWLPMLIGALKGTTNQITVTPDPTTGALTVAISENPVLPGNTKIDSTGYLKIPVGTTEQRPNSPEAGMIRFNTSE